MRVQLHPAVEGELARAAEWYEERVLGLGDALLDEVEHWFEVIAETPDTWPLWPGVRLRDPPVRRVLLGRFPHAIAYQAFEERVFVLAVASTSRKPCYWVTRTEDGSA